MGISPVEAGRLSLWQYTAALAQWNMRQDEARGDPHSGVEPPSIEEYNEGLEAIRALNDPAMKV